MSPGRTGTCQPSHQLSPRPLNKLCVMNLLRAGRGGKALGGQRDPPTPSQGLRNVSGAVGKPFIRPGLQQPAAVCAGEQVWRGWVFTPEPARARALQSGRAGSRNIGSGVRGVMFGLLPVENVSYSGLGCLICSQTCFFIRLQRGLWKDPPRVVFTLCSFPGANLESLSGCLE